MKRVLFFVLSGILVLFSCDDEDELKFFTVDVHELQGITIHLNDGDINVNLRESYEEIKAKLPEVQTDIATSFDFYQIGFNFGTATHGGYMQGSLNTITIFNPDKSWFYKDRYRLRSFTTDSGITLETATKSNVQQVYGVGDESDQTIDRYGNLDMKFRYEEIQYGIEDCQEPGLQQGYLLPENVTDYSQNGGEPVYFLGNATNRSGVAQIDENGMETDPLLDAFPFDCCGKAIKPGGHFDLVLR
jgi:hypothetical protein